MRALQRHDMNSPVTALAWEIWWRGKRTAWLALGCVAICAFINLALLGRLHMSDNSRDIFFTLYRMLMTLSLFLSMGIFNYTEYNSTREWNGFPYRLFTLPVTTWKLVTVPMFLCVAYAELIFFAWIKLVWTREVIPMTGWFAVVLGAYVIFYQTTLWCLAGFKILRIVALSLGGVSSVLIASAPFFATLFHLPWLTERLLMPAVIVLAMISYAIALTAVTRQRYGGGRRWSWTRALGNWLVDALPKRTRDFSSPSAAQFWFEWRRAGWLLPCCVAFVILILLPFSWFRRHDAGFTEFTLIRLLVAPLILALVVGKGFVNCEFWSTNRKLPHFLAARPLSAVEYVEAKMKVAAVSVVVAWLLVFAFLLLWFMLWANVDDLRMEFYLYRIRNPDFWLATGALSCVGLMLVSWRLMVGGLWLGLSGNRSYCVAWSTLQILIPAFVLLAVGICSDTIDHECKTNLVFMQSLAINGLSWGLAILVIAKFWLAAFAWSTAEPGFGRRYCLVWAGGLALFLTLAVLASPFYDPYRITHLCLLAALLGLPLVRIALAPLSFAKNRHEQVSSEFMPILRVKKTFAILAVLVTGAAIVLAIDPGRFVFRYVDAGGHPLRILISGQGSPAVVFEAGGSPASGSALEAWNWIQPAVSQYATTVSYDRAGIGWSLAGPGFRDARRVAAELHTALRNAGVRPPYLLVGQSFGGPLNRVFADMYPSDVCGMVLVDPTQEEAIEWDLAHNSNNGDAKRQDEEWKEIKASLDEAHASRVAPGIPVVLITGMGPKTFPGFISEKKVQQYRESRKRWLKFHQEWVDKIPDAKHIIDENAGHAIPFMDPGIVINAISNVIAQVESPASGSDKPTP